MKEYIDEMLRLTASVADRLLLIKDTDAEIDAQLNLDIQNLAVISDREITRVMAELDQPAAASEPEPLPEPERVPASLPVDEPETQSEDEPETEIQSEEKEIALSAQYEEVSDACPAKIDVAVLKNAFSINDIFLYQRSLFGGSAERFDKTLQATAAMTSVDELRTYLAEVQQVNVKSHVAKDFISVLGSYLSCE